MFICICVCYTHVCTWVCLCVAYTCVCTCSKLMGIYVWYIYAYVLICGVCTVFLCMCMAGWSYLCSQRLTSDVLVFFLPALGLQAPIPILRQDAGDSSSGPHRAFYPLNCFCHSILSVLSVCLFKIDVTLYSVLKVTSTCVSFICYCSSRQINILTPNFNNL